MDDTENKNANESETTDPAAFIDLPKNIASLSLTAQTILEELRVRHRRLAMHGSSEITPALLLTIDSLPELLSKQVGLTENHKTTQAINEALRELAGISEHNKERVVFFYPFLLSVDGNIVIRICMIAPQNKEKTDITPYRRAFLKYSIDLIDQVLKNRSQKEIFVDETNPGNQILSKDKNGNTHLFPYRLGYEFELETILRKSLEPFVYIPLKEFITDVITHGKEVAKLIEIAPKYHTFLPSNSHNTESIGHLLIQLNGLLQFMFPYLKRYCIENKYHQFFQELETLEKSIPSDTNELKKEYQNIISKLKETIKEFPFEKLVHEDVHRVRTSIFESIKIIEKLQSLLNLQKKNDVTDSIQTLIQNLKLRIEENTEQTQTLTKIDLIKEINSLDLKHITDNSNILSEIVSALNEEFGCIEIKESNMHILFATVPAKLSFVEKNTYELAKLDPKYKDELSILDQISTQLRISGKLDSLKPLQQNKEKTKEETSKFKQSFLEGLQTQFHLPIAILCFISLATLSTISAIFLSKLNIIFYGFVFSLFFALLIGYIFRKEAKVESKSQTGQQIIEPKNNSLLPIVEPIIFPKKFNHITEKLFDHKRLRYKIEEEIDTIIAKLPSSFPKKDKNKIIAEVEHTILQIAVIIKIPEVLQVKGRTREIILPKSDFKTILFRTQLAEYYRKEAGLFKSDRDQMDYLQFIIRELEFGYNKYIKM
ncbi:hypothetical protein P3G55_04605 [Leptospira sp. 96542]|nr:hypothetical protein [Leptospira sp. 96542]